MSIVWRTPVTDWQPADYLNAADLTRIEGNIEWLSDYLMSHYYNVQTYPHREWEIADIPESTDIERICNKITEIMDNYYAPEGFEDSEISDIPDSPLDNDDVNYLERCLLLIKEMIDSGKSYNTHQALKALTHAQLAAYQHPQVRKDGSIL